MAKETVYTTVTMADARIVDFPGKARLLKSSFITEDGKVSVRLDFVNGETRLFVVPAEMLPQFAAHGAEQKLGDEIAGVSDVDDAVLAIDELCDRLTKGEWSAKREASGLAGTSILLRAIVAVTGKPIDKIKEYLKGKTAAEKMALRASPRYSGKIAELEAAKAEKAAKVDVAALDTEIDALA
jgi:hypothetical protein